MRFHLLSLQTQPKKEPAPVFNDLVGDSLRQPSVNLLNSTVPVEPVRSTIGVRKIQPKKGVNNPHFL